MTEAATIPAPVVQPPKTPDVAISQLPEKEKDKSRLLHMQPKLTVGAPDDPYEKEADAVADTVMRSSSSLVQRKCAACGQEDDIVKRSPKTPMIQRTLSVTNTPPPNMPTNDAAASVPFADKVTHFNNVIQALCPSFTVNSTGAVVPVANPAPTPAALDAGSNPTGCCGLSILTSSVNNWQIAMSQLQGPHTDPPNFLFVLPPANSDITFGHFTAGGTRALMNDVIVAGHEMVGHGAQIELNIHNTGNEDRESFNHHNPTVRIQNAIAAEQGAPAADARGLAESGVHRGESFARVEINGFGFNSNTVSALPQAEQDKIQLMANFVLENGMWVDITGHSDPVGSAAGKQFVSDQRATAVQNRLIALGVTRIFSKTTLPTYQYIGRPRYTEVRGVSDTQPPLTGAANHANWRRVEIFATNHPAGAGVPPTDIPPLQQATPGAGLPAARTSTNPCHQRIANTGFPTPAPVTPAPVQPKLMVGEADSPLEKEADTVADTVMRMPANFVQRKCAACEKEEEHVHRKPQNGHSFLIHTMSDATLQRECAECEKEEEEELHRKPLTSAGSFVQRKAVSPTVASMPVTAAPFVQKKCAECETEEEENAQRKPQQFLQAKASDTPNVSDSLSQSIQSSRGSGFSMDNNTQSFMSDRIGADLSSVNIHTGSEASTMNNQLQAKAFTIGKDIYFNDGQYQPHSDSGKRLLAHELTHVVQQGHAGELIQKQDAPQSKRVSIAVKIPPGTTSKEQFRRYAETVIFGKVVNKEWTASDSAAKVYADIANHVGETVKFSVNASELAEHGEPNTEQNKEKKEADAAYLGTTGEERDEINEEIDKRYHESTGIPEDTKIVKGDKASEAVWHSFKQQVMMDKKKLDALPKAVKEFLHSDQTFSPENYAKLSKLADILSQFSEADLADYKSKVNAETSDLDVLADSLRKYLLEKEQRKKQEEDRETIKTKLHGMEALYKIYKSYKSIQGIRVPSHDEYGVYDPTAQQIEDDKEKIHTDLIALLKENDFNSIAEFEKYIADYEAAFRKETISIAKDILQKYRHVLFEEEKKITDDAYLTTLLSEIQGSGAKDLYKQAAGNESVSNSIHRDEFGVMVPSDRQLKAETRRKASEQRAAASSALTSLPSANALIKEEQFNKQELASVSSKDALRTMLKDYIKKKRDDIDETWKDITGDTDKIYNLDKLFQYSYQAQGIQKGSIFDLIIQDKVKEIGTGKIIKAIVLAVIGIALTIATMGTGTIAVLAGVGALGLGMYQAYEEFKQYEEQSAAHGAGLLSQEPTLAWVVLAIVGAGLDAAALASIARVAQPIAKAGKAFNETEDLAKLEADLAQIAEITETVRKNIVRAGGQELKARQSVRSIFMSDGTLKMVIVPFGEEFAKLVVAAYHVVRKGILDFESFLLEMKAMKLIDTSTLSAAEKVTLKKAFEQAKDTTKTMTDLTPELEKAIKEFRASTGISREVTAQGVKGGTSAAAKPKIEGFADDVITEGSTRSKGASAATVENNPRYQSPQKFGGTKNHAEQNVLGDLADKLDVTFAKKADAKGNLYMLVEQEVCSSCRQGLANADVLPGVVKQFSGEYPNITLIISNKRTAEVLFVRDGKVINYLKP
jgi:outer membrane protein OmpA-like peptidoglycan-associated protein